jgi:hypothetical protein
MWWGKPIGKMSYGKLIRSLKGTSRGVELSGYIPETLILSCALKNLTLTLV